MRLRKYSEAAAIHDFLMHTELIYAAPILGCVLEIANRIPGAVFVFDSDKDEFPFIEVGWVRLWIEFEADEIFTGTASLRFTVEVDQEFDRELFHTNEIDAAVNRFISEIGMTQWRRRQPMRSSSNRFCDINTS